MRNFVWQTIKTDATGSLFCGDFAIFHQISPDFVVMAFFSIPHELLSFRLSHTFLVKSKKKFNQNSRVGNCGSGFSFWRFFLSNFNRFVSHLWWALQNSANTFKSARNFVALFSYYTAYSGQIVSQFLQLSASFKMHSAVVKYFL